MASVVINKNNNGKIISYRMRCCIGRNELGKQIFATKTMPVPVGLTPIKAIKQMENDAENWERDIHAGTVPLKKQHFDYFVNSI